MVGDAAATDGCVFDRLRTAGVSAVDEWSLGEKEILMHSPNKEKERNDRPLSKKDINKNVIQNRYQRC